MPTKKKKKGIQPGLGKRKKGRQNGKHKKNK